MNQVGRLPEKWGAYIRQCFGSFPLLIFCGIMVLDYLFLLESIFTYMWYIKCTYESSSPSKLWASNTSNTFTLDVDFCTLMDLAFPVLKFLCIRWDILDVHWFLNASWESLGGTCHVITAFPGRIWKHFTLVGFFPVQYSHECELQVILNEYIYKTELISTLWASGET